MGRDGRGEMREVPGARTTAERTAARWIDALRDRPWQASPARQAASRRLRSRESIR